MKQPSLERVMWENGELCGMIRATPGCILIYNCLSVTQELSISGSLLLVDSGSRPVSSILMNLFLACSTLVSINIVDMVLDILSVRVWTATHVLIFIFLLYRLL